MDLPGLPIPWNQLVSKNGCNLMSLSIGAKPHWTRLMGGILETVTGSTPLTGLDDLLRLDLMIVKRRMHWQ